MFQDRLKEFREKTLGLETKREMADRLDISEQLYAMVERGDRSPSKNFMRKLVVYSKLPEEYWLYGVKREDEILEKRREFKSVESTVLDLIDDGYITDINFDDDIKELLITAIKADIQHILLKRK